MNDSLKWLDEPIAAPDEKTMQAATLRQSQLTKPPGSLGRLEDIAIRFAGFQRDLNPTLTKIVVRVFAADHGIAARGVSAFPQSVTAQMVENFTRGGAAVCVLSRTLNADFLAVNMGCLHDVSPHAALVHSPIATSTADFSTQHAMTQAQMHRALKLGADQTHAADLFIGGEMGIGNTTSAAAILAALFKLNPTTITGRGTGVDDATLAHKTELIEKALVLHKEQLTDPLAILQCLGGFEIAALVGAFIASAQMQTPILVDGFIATAAAALALAINPGVKPWLLYAHQSDEQGHQLALQELGAKPLLNLNMRLGEGSGAVLAANIIREALALHSKMATFAEAGVSGAH
ncbi:nicotinate-nucleotide--dimethylbenzimidazole phosphoribosyltransferase [Gilvimarinus xylanilyticus]|uniref:Nicotinate-nucleotide--dimethylbenzimidazole phosphoribosyltransferase n=1 Tax=Gilvimarinus xylanilyticus TaxID=2944139 RepID=A0A9X2HV98_9GAMM|nr:nicotinate-nucleotide--dimethylbenzimidazole phosphoribosyltransferase [Gilvimarinus xylanilyticus]MCP8899073.1 nicotinate-nucleotide--dimethylbenzimidazole phosphoribosyltransferase [Gilvimarinus xylanilyticus]